MTIDFLRPNDVLFSSSFDIASLNLRTISSDVNCSRVTNVCRIILCIFFLLKYKRTCNRFRIIFKSKLKFTHFFIWFHFKISKEKGSTNTFFIDPQSSHNSYAANRTKKKKIHVSWFCFLRQFTIERSVLTALLLLITKNYNFIMKILKSYTKKSKWTTPTDRYWSIVRTSILIFRLFFFFLFFFLFFVVSFLSSSASFVSMDLAYGLGWMSKSTWSCLTCWLRKSGQAQRLLLWHRCKCWKIGFFLA